MELKKKIQPLYNTVYLTDFDKRIREKKVGSIIIDTLYDQTGTYEAVHEATVYEAPLMSSDGSDLEIKKGDRVIAHHFLTDPSCVKDLDGVEISELLYLNIFARFNGGVVEPIQDYCFVEPVKQKDAKFKHGIIQKRTGNKTQVGILRFLNPNMASEGFKEGDKVIFMKNRDYEIMIDGTVYYKMKDSEIECLIDGDIDKVEI